MRTIRGFFPDINTESNIILIYGEYFNYFVSVLRLKEGNHISLFNNIDSLEYDVEIIKINKKDIHAQIVSSKKIDTENSYDVNLYQAIIKNENFDLVIQKATELGVNNIIPTITNRTNHKFDKKHFDKKILRWQKIAISAAEQCGRVFTPKITNVINIEKIAQDNHLNIILDPYIKNDSDTSNKILDNNSFNIFIGPEGGFTEEEINQLKQLQNTLHLNLGNRILKSETAHINIMSIINYLKN